MALETNGFKTIMTFFIGAIITLAIILTIGNTIVGQTETQTTVDLAVTAPAENQSVELLGRKLVGTVDTIINASGDDVSNNFTVGQGIGTDGLLTIIMTTNSAIDFIEGEALTLNYTYEPEGYVNNTGARSITRLILIFAALAIFIFGVVVLYQKDSPLSKIISGFK